MADHASDMKTPPGRSPGTAASRPDTLALDKAFEALKTYDAGSSRGALEPIDTEILAALTDARRRQEVERRLAGLLGTDASIWAKEYVCSKLRLIGGAASVSALVPLLADPHLSDAARSALQTMSCPEATRALRDALATLPDALRLGVIGSLGKRRDTGSVRALVRLLESPDTATAAAAAGALGDIGTAKAARSLRKFLAGCPEAVRLVVVDAGLTCAERLAAAGNRDEAREMGRALDTSAYPAHVRFAATRRLSGAAPPK